MPYLVVRERGRVFFTVPIRGRLDVGRGQDNDLVLADRQASRHHARFTDDDGQVTVSDLGSTHGTMVNAEPIRQRGLRDGDVVQIGNVLLGYREGMDESNAEEVSVAGRPAPATGRLQALYDLGRAIGAGDEPRELAARALDSALAVLGCERGVIGLSDGRSAAGKRVARWRAPGGGDEVVVSGRLVDEVVGKRRSVLVRLEQSGPTLTIAREGVRAAMAAPLLAGERVLGFIYVDDRARADLFAPEELDFLTALAHLIAAALDQSERLRRQAAIAELLARPTDELLAASAPMLEFKARLARYAQSADMPVLLRGESGTGKELVARTLHALSPRAGEPFVTVNCAALPDTLLESELFGHQRGSFTGAGKARRGRFAMAHGGTLFLDEIGDLSGAGQAKILRALEEGEIQPLGADETIEVDVRVIAATHRPLEADIAAGRFRQDLYYRLAAGELVLPPLRDRGDDILLLAEAFLARAACPGVRPVALGAAARAALLAHAWPGNVRELRNEIERAVLFADGPELDLPELGARGQRAPGARPEGLAERFARLDVDERALVAEALERAGGNVSEAARLLGISRIMLRRRMDRFAV